MPPKGTTRKKLPEPLPEGLVLTDSEKRHWKLGKVIGSGGFGLIHLAAPASANDVGNDAKYVIKIEYQENGPLFSELKFYQRAAKPEHIKAWIKSHKLSFLGIPAYWGSGLTKHNGKSYRFMVIDRLGVDLQKLLEARENRLDKTSALKLGCQLLDILEFIHEHEYIHGDIKSANLLLGFKNHKEVYLADYGLAFRYCPNGAHKCYKEDRKKGHNGTIEFTSIDAHKGVAPSRRSDLEILGYCLLQWLCGKLPWEQDLKDPVAVQHAKVKFMENLPTSVHQCFPPGYDSSEIVNYLSYVSTLKYEERPQYQKLHNILLNCREASQSNRVDLSGKERMESWLLSVPENSKRKQEILPSQNVPVLRPRSTRQNVHQENRMKGKSNNLSDIECSEMLKFKEKMTEAAMPTSNLVEVTEFSEQYKTRKQRSVVQVISPIEAEPVHQNQRIKSDILHYGAAVVVLSTLIIFLVLVY